MNPHESTPEILITGIPRSGTSYLCRLLHNIKDCIIINEPKQMFKRLNQELPWEVVEFYQQLRVAILAGKAIENKFKDGQVIENTIIIDEHTTYQPTVSRPDFLLGTKNTLGYMARLPQLQKVFPYATIIANIRHPLDTIASWQLSFSHLKTADVANFVVGYVTDPLLSSWQQERLQAIAKTTDIRLKRALLWKYLADWLLKNQQFITIIRYEELVTKPIEMLTTILNQVPNSPPLELIHPIKPSTIKHHLLADDETKIIREICGTSATQFGYSEF